MKEYNTSSNEQMDDFVKDIKLSDLLDIPALQKLMDSFFNLTGIPTAILDLEGDILVASGWKKICTDFHRKNPITASRCLESDTILASGLKKGQQFNLYKCKNGLIDVATPLILENRHLGNLFTGQFLLEKPEIDFFIKQAEQFGFDKKQYLDALLDVPIFSESQIKKTMNFLADLTTVIGNTGLDKKRLMLLSKNLEKEVKIRTSKLKKANEQLNIEIDEHKRTENDLQQSVLWQKEAVRAVNIGLWDWEVGTEKVHYSPVWKSQIGYSDEEIKDTFEEWSSRVHPDDLDSSMEKIQECLDSKSESYLTEFRFRHKNGKYLWILSQGSVLKDESGHPVRMIGSHLDITDHKYIEQALQNSERRYHTLVQTAPSIIIQLSSEGTIVEFNSEAEKFYGFDRSEVIGKNYLEEFIPEEARIYVEEDIKKVLQGKTTKGFENPVLDTNGQQRVLIWDVAPLLDDNNTATGIIAVGRDITDRKQEEIEREKLISDQNKAHEALKQSEENLKKSNEELELFAYAVSHDLQAPLRSIIGFLQLLESRYSDILDEKGKHYIERSVSGGKRMHTLIADLLALSRISTQNDALLSSDIKEIIQSALDNLQSVIDEKKTIIVADHLPEIPVDASQIQRLFQNLIMNGLKYNQSSKPKVEIGYKNCGDSNPFFVKDNGIGISEKFHEKIFGVFQRLHTGKEYPGSGMGLALCKKIVEHHGGKIWVESEPGKGSTFYFTLGENNDLKE